MVSDHSYMLALDRGEDTEHYQFRTDNIEDEEVLSEFVMDFQDEIHAKEGVLRPIMSPIPLSVRVDSDGCHVTLPDLDLSISDIGYEEAMDSVRDMIAILWEEYAIEKDEVLTDGAIALKRQLKRLYAGHS